MKLKYYLRGAGLGIIFATLIMIFACSQYNNLSDSEIIEKATKLGMVMPESETEKESEPQQVMPEPETEKESEPQQEIPAVATLEVVSGMVAKDIANLLYEMGLITDAEVFCNYMIENGIAENIVVGSYEIPVGATKEQIVDILCAGNGVN